MNETHSIRISYLFLPGLLVAASIGLAACGGSSSSDSGPDTDSGTGNLGDPSGTDFTNVKQATIFSDKDAAEVAYAATEGVYQGINSSNAENAIPIGGLVSEYDIREALALDARELAAAVQPISGLPVGAIQTVEGTCGGSATINTGDDEFPENGTASYKYTYTDYCLALDDTSSYNLDGTAEYSFTNVSGQLTKYTYSWDLTYKITGEDAVTSRVTGTTTCLLESSTYTCTYSDDFTGPNGEVYRVENVAVTQSGNGTYDASARVYDTDVGYVDFSASGILQCSNGNFENGTIEITDSTGAVVVEVSFPDCNQCIVTFGGNAESYPQPTRTTGP